MRVGIDARTLLIPKKRGIGRYVDHLLDNMIKLDPSIEFILFGEKENLKHDYLKTKLLSSKGYRFRLWEKAFFPFSAWKEKCDMIHCPANTCPPFALCPIILTIHDLNLLKDPLRKNLDFALYFKKQLSSAIKVSYAILTVSNYCKQDLISTFPDLSEKKVHVIHNGLNLEKFHLVKEHEIKKSLPRFDLTKKYILMLGAKDQFKGTELGFKAYVKVASEIKHNLIITSLSKDLREEYQQKIDSYGLTDRVHLLDFISDDELNALYNLAEMFLFPSKYEGFGFPLLEALYCHCRVIANDIPTTREIAGKHAIIVQHDVDSFADAILAASKDVMCYDFTDQAKHSLSFSWKDSALKTLEIYKSILKS